MSRIKNKKTAMGMVATMLLSSLLFGFLSAMDTTMQLPVSVPQPLPLGLPDRIAGAPLLAIALFLGMGVAGLVLSISPSALSRKKMLLAGLLLLVTATLLAVFAGSTFALFFWRFTAGVGFCMHFCAWLSIGLVYFPRHCSMLVACLNFVSGIGTILGRHLLFIILDAGAWYDKLLLLAGLGLPILALLFLLIMLFFVRASTDERRCAIQAETVSIAKSPWSSSPLLLALASVCMTLVLHSFANVYTQYLREATGLPNKTAVLVVSMVVLAIFLSQMGGWLGSRYGTFKVLLIASPLTGAIGGLLFMGWQMPLILLLPLTFLVGFGLHALLYVNLLAGIVKAVAPVQNMRTVGLFSAAISLPAPFASVIFLRLQSNLGWGGASLLHITGGLLLTTLLVWVALKTLRPLVRTVHQADLSPLCQ